MRVPEVADVMLPEFSLPLVTLHKDGNVILSILVTSGDCVSGPSVNVNFELLRNPPDFAAGKVMQMIESDQVESVFVHADNSEIGFLILTATQASLAMWNMLSAMLRWCFARYYKTASISELEELWSKLVNEVSYRNFQVEVNANEPFRQSTW